MYRSRLKIIIPQNKDTPKMVQVESNIKLKAKNDDRVAKIEVNRTETPILTCLIRSDSGHLSNTVLLTPEQNKKKSDSFIGLQFVFKMIPDFRLSVIQVQNTENHFSLSCVFFLRLPYFLDWNFNKKFINLRKYFCISSSFAFFFLMVSSELEVLLFS